MTPHPYLVGITTPRILAHRGFVSPNMAEQGIAENTRAAFRAAVEAGAHYLESDCRLTSDGAVVLIHDSSLDRIAADSRPVEDISHRELATIMADRGGLLTLDQLLEEFPDAHINIDIKSAAAAEPAAELIAPHTRRVLLASFDDRIRRRSLQAIAKRGAPAPATGPGRRHFLRVLLASVTGSRRLVDRALAEFDAIQIPDRTGRFSVLSRRLIDAAHQNSVEVHVWTVNDPQRMRELIEMGVDGIITDRTDLAVAALR